MTPRDLAELLTRVPETKLQVYDLVRQVLGPDGALDVERVATLGGEMDDVKDQAQAYSAQVQMLRAALARLTTP